MKAWEIAPEVIWRRIESFIAWRWGERDCTFITEGGRGSWKLPLYPFTVVTTEVWQAEAWRPLTLAPHPLGGFVIGAAEAYRITGVLGSDGNPPGDVLEAYRRLAEYSAVAEDYPGASAFTEEIGSLKIVEDRAPTWLARAMQYSGAADLLRPYRRVP